MEMGKVSERSIPESGTKKEQRQWQRLSSQIMVVSEVLIDITLSSIELVLMERITITEDTRSTHVVEQIYY